jgi:hypothetical protein
MMRAVASFQEEMLTRRGSLMVVVALMLIALGVRLHSVAFALPFFQESDPHIFEQIGLLRHGDLTPELLQRSSIYPHLLGRIVVLFQDPLLPPSDPDSMTLAQHLARAGGLHVLVRSIVSVASVFLIPGAWLLARRLFSPGWALFATTLVAFSLLNLQFGQQARPHSFAAPFFVFAVAAAVRMRNTPNLSSWLLCGLACGLSLAALQSGTSTLFPVAAAFFLREPEGRRWLEWRVLPALLVAFVFVRVFWPFAFVSPPGAETGVEAGTIRVSDQTLSFSEFTGEGFTTVFLTLWYYEPVQLILAELGVLVMIVSFVRRRSGDARKVKDALVMVAYAVPYAVVIGMHERAQQRFVVPLIPFVALLSTVGLRGALRWVVGGRPNEALVSRVAAAMALAVPVLATSSFARVRSRPHTLGSVAAWIEDNVDPATERVGLHNLYDVPLVRRLENQFVDGQWGGEVRKPALYGTPWAYYQHTIIGPGWRGTRWWIEPMYHQGETNLREVMEDPEGYIRGLGLNYVVLPGEHGASFHPLLQGMRETAMRIGTLEAKFPETERMRVETKYEGLDTPHYTKFILTAPQLGPEVEIYRIRAAGE